MVKEEKSSCTSRTISPDPDDLSTRACTNDVIAPLHAT